MQNNPNTTLVTPTAPIDVKTHGGRAKCLQRLVRLDLPVPTTVALSFDAVHRIAEGHFPDIDAILQQFPDDCLLCVRPSSEDPDWGGPSAFLNIGMTPRRYTLLSGKLGADAARAMYLRFVHDYSIDVDRLDPDMFDHIEGENETALKATLEAYQAETDTLFPDTRAAQLTAVLKSMARAWEGTSARLLRQAKGAPADAGLGLVIQQMAFGMGQGESGSGLIQLVSSVSGREKITGRYMPQSQGRDGLWEKSGVLFIARDERGASLQDAAPDIFERVVRHATLMRDRLREQMQLEFVIENGALFVLDGIPVSRSSRAAVRIAVELAQRQVISHQDALMRVAPGTLNELLHRQVDRDAPREVIGSGIAASPGAATGKLVFSAAEAQSSAARDEPCILVRRETSPEDVRGMHAAQAVITERGGATSHAAVIGRGIGLPCVVGVEDMIFHPRRKELVTKEGRVISEGDIVTVDGTHGTILMGAPNLLEAALDDAFQTLMQWAGEECDIGIRANADTPIDALTALRFDANGIGLCRTEHMFFDQNRLTVMREMIFAETSADRRAALERLLPMQRADFKEIFRTMNGRPVTIRLFDPPLHEFLPMDRTGQRALADALDLPLSDVTRRIEAMMEYNPMLGLRGVRLGVTVPEIYEMQAEAIFEAAIEENRQGNAVAPEIMIPLVSAKREVELVCARVEAVAAAVKSKHSMRLDYRIGVMVETPRAALRAGEIAQHVSFLSFGTNDLTQMTYGLSRDDAGRFMSDYVQRQVFAEDPFRSLDTEGVGELLELGIARGRETRPDLVLSICGEHGADPDSIAFCRALGFDYVSCSPFRVPIARLAAAQFAIQDKIGAPDS